MVGDAMSVKSTQSHQKSKPKKPYDGFPMYSHRNGLWAKKIRGKTVFFGPWKEDRCGTKALEKFNREWPFLSEGRTPPPVQADGLSIANLCNVFLTSKNKQLTTGDITPRTFHDNLEICKRIISQFGRNRMVDDLRADDFENLRSAFSSTHGPLRLAKDITVSKSVFKYGYEAGLIEQPIRFGPHFNIPSRKVIMQNRAKNGKRMFESEELRLILETAPQSFVRMMV
jgi:hypothetical protein